MTAIPIRELSGGQLQELMDTLLYAALTPVVENTDLFTPQLAYVLSLLVTNKKRKPCAADPEQATYLLIRALSAPRSAKMEYIKRIGLERNFVYGFLKNFISYYEKPYMDLYTRFLQNAQHQSAETLRQQLDNMVHGAGAESRTGLYNTIIRVNYVLPEFFTVFEAAVSNYIGFCAQQAKSYVAKNPNHQYDVKDVTQNFIGAVIVALNKYDCDRGAQSTYVKWWIMHAQTCGSSGHEYGLAYTIPQSQRKRLAIGDSSGGANFSVSLDQQPEDDEGSSLHDRLGGESEDLESEIGHSRLLRRLAEVAKRVDPCGIARLQYDMDEVFFPEEIQIMNDHMAEEKSVKDTVLKQER